MKIVKKEFVKEKELVAQKLLNIPIIENCEFIGSTTEGFSLLIELQDGSNLSLFARVLHYAYPKQVTMAIDSFQKTDRNEYLIIVAPYISETTDVLCKQRQVGYFDFSGNVYFCNHSIYISETGSPNSTVKRRHVNNIFKTSSVVSSAILRKLLVDVEKSWKLKYLAEEVGCSIGQVSKVKEFLCQQLWAQMSEDGLKITKSEELLKAWSKEYQITSFDSYPCYTLMPLPMFEERLKKMKENTGIDYCLTGFSGGSRYSPTVRYNRVHVWVSAADIREFISEMDCKEVESGANIIIYSATQDDVFIDSREIQGCSIASPVQVYLDCMQLKGRGEEMAEAVYTKEIRK